LERRGCGDLGYGDGWNLKDKEEMQKKRINKKTIEKG